MTVKNLIGSLAHGAVSGAFAAVRHPLGTTARALGLVKGAAEVGLGIVRGEAGTTHPTSTPEAPPEHEEAVRAAADRAAAPPTPPAKKAATKKAPAKKAAAKKAPAGPPPLEPRPAAPQRTPEQLAEPFMTEPTAATRDSAHGGPPRGREEIDDYAEEVRLDPTDDIGVETPVGTTGADVGTNPDTAESDLQQPGTPPLLDPALAKSVRSESETLQKAADVHKQD